METLIAAALCAVMAGSVTFYQIGLRKGRRQGIEQGSAQARLVLRHQALSEGICPICHPFPVNFLSEGDLVYHTGDWVGKGEEVNDDEPGKGAPRSAGLGANRGDSGRKYDESKQGL